ncbi:MAG: GNAT family N-acetyltransferase [Christensenellaceae bacterium]
MNFRLANSADLAAIKEMYTMLISKMNKDGIEIWDNVYPCEIFADDIAKNSLYILSDENNMVGAFALCESNNGQTHVKWEKDNAKAIYLDRLGVNANFTNQGIATQLLNYACKIASKKGAEYLRLFVIDTNVPAVRLYKKNGFKKAVGSYVEVIDETLTFVEFGFEKNVTSRRKEEHKS